MRGALGDAAGRVPLDREGRREYTPAQRDRRGQIFYNAAVFTGGRAIESVSTTCVRDVGRSLLSTVTISCD